MSITMVKKRLTNGAPCPKCVQAQEMIDRRGYTQRIDHVVWAQEGDSQSEGFLLAQKYGIEQAPFFIVQDEKGERTYTSVIAFLKEVLENSPSASPSSEKNFPWEAPEAFAQLPPTEQVRKALALHGKQCRIAFSGAEDVAVVDMAVRSEQPFSVFCLDTGRLHAETYRFLDRVRKHYGIEIELLFPEFVAVEQLVRNKGLYSFYEDGHGECCGIRKVVPLRRALKQGEAWMTGQRRDQSPTRTDVPAVQIDKGFAGAKDILVKYNPLAMWSLSDVWNYLRSNKVPTNELHEKGFISIGCEPCTRATGPGEHERAGRWWWEEATKRECGLHVAQKTS